MSKNKIHQLLLELPEKPYKVMKPFVDLQFAKIKADSSFKPSKSWGDLSEEWNVPRTDYSERIANGSLNIKTAYNSLKNHPSGAALQRQLLVHDFFGQINKFGEETFYRDWKAPWILSDSEEQRRLKIWKNGQTGYKIIDAAMLELKSEGFICNRLRMLCASYLTKNMLVDWRLGEKHFADLLIDYGDGASNVGNWLWVSNAGFNNRVTAVIRPEIQQLKVDPHGTLVAKWAAALKATEIEFDYDETKKLWLKAVS